MDDDDKNDKNKKSGGSYGLYDPSIFRFSCRGALQVSTTDSSWQNSDKGQIHYRSLCRGIQSRLHHVKDLNRTHHPADATHVFLQAANYPQQTQSSSSSSSQSSSSQSSSDWRNGNALLFPDDDQDDHYCDWSCYGSTEVHLLVLRNVRTQQDKIVGVAPDCRYGLSVKDIGAKDSLDRFHTIRLGVAEITLGRHYDYSQQEQEHNGAIVNDNTPRQVYEMSQKIVLAMKQNAILLRDSLSDDFPSRMMDSSQRIANQFGKTLDRTAKLMRSVYKLWSRRDGDN